MLFPLQGYSQNCMWSNHAGGTSNDGGRMVVSDKYGNTYVSGFSNSSTCYFNNDTIIGNGGFIVKYDNNGNEIWVLDLVTGSGPNVGEYSSIDMQMDTINNHLLLTGSFYNYLRLKDTIIYGLKNTIFLIKMDMDGNIIWYKTAGGTGDDQAFGLAYDLDGNIYISGSNENDATFNQTTIARGGFLAKYDANGNVIWAKNKFRFFEQWGSGIEYPFTEAEPCRLKFVNNSLLINGVADHDTLVFDSAIFINVHGFGSSSYIASYSIDGNLNWVKLAGGPMGICGSSFATDKSNNIYITGLYTITGVFGNDTLKQPGGRGDCFLAKYDFTGNLKWVNSTNSSAMGLALATSLDSSIYLGGFFSGTAYFGNTILTSISDRDMFLAKYSTNGNNIGVRQYPTKTPMGMGIAVDSSNNVCFTGNFTDTLSIGSNTFISRGQNDLFVAKCSPIIGEVENLKAVSNQLLIYANPNSGTCTIDIPDNFKNEKSLTLTIFNSQGKVIEKAPIEITDEKISLNIQAQAAGMYNVILTNGKKSYSGKIVFK
jgi:hypothetical protein